MNNKVQNLSDRSKRIRLNLALVGGGETCRHFLEFLGKVSPPHLDIHILGVCDIHPQAHGLQLAKKLGIFTTQDCREIFKIEGLHGVLELTHRRDVLLELARYKPDDVWIIDHLVCELVQNFLLSDQELGRKEREMTLEKTVSEFLLQQANERILVLDPDFSILEASEGYLKAVNKSRDRVIGRHCYEISHGLSSPCSEWLPEMGCPMVETLRTGQSAHAIHEHIIEGESRSYCDLETFPVRINGDGEIVRIVEIWRDITEALSSRWEARVSQLKTDLEKLAQEDRLISLGKLSASCVHEINNPIQGLLTFCSLMQSIVNKGMPAHDDLEEFKHYLGLMSRELERCGAIISGLLSFSRESAMEARDVDLLEVFQAVLSLTRHRMELQDIDPVLELAEESLIVRGDVNQFQQCFLNLIFNAIEAMPGGGALKVTLKPDEAAKEALITIEDSGCGISENYIDKIFDPFFTTKEEGQGTGMGLSIVYGIVKNHGGKIEVQSREGRGTSFSLRFPLVDYRQEPEDG
jgi:two-component system, NtrC family, sensor kinase